jgi:hypothetical protein
MQSESSGKAAGQGSEPSLPEEFKKEQQAFLDSLSETERSLLYSYTIVGDSIINSVLRGVKMEKDELKEKIKWKLDKVNGKRRTIVDLIPEGNVEDTIEQRYTNAIIGILNKAPVLKEELTVYRGISTPGEYRPTSNEILSTSYDKSVAERFGPYNETQKCCIFTLHLKPGTRVLWIQPVSKQPQEREILVVPPFKESNFTQTGKYADLTISPSTAGASRKRRITRRRRTRRRKSTP